MKHLVFVLALLWAQAAYAVTAIEAWVDTDCGTNGNGVTSECAKGAGEDGAYITLSDALTGESAARSDLVARDESLTILLEGTVADTTAPVSFTNALFTTNATHTVRLKGAETPTGRHPGYWSESHYRLTGAACSGGGVLVIAENYVYVDDFQIENTGTSDTGCNNGIVLNLVNGVYTNVYANGMFIRGNPAGNPQTTSYGIYMTYLQGGRVVYIANNVVTGVSNAGIFIGCGGLNDQITVYNNTSYGNAFGIRLWEGNLCSSGGSTFHMKNNLLQGNSGAGYNRPSVGGTHPIYDFSSNITSDSSSPDGAEYRNQTAQFVNAPALDFHLAKIDTAATDKCISLATDATYQFVRDMEYTQRASRWDCGADEQPDRFRMNFFGVEW